MTAEQLDRFETDRAEYRAEAAPDLDIGQGAYAKIAAQHFWTTRSNLGLERLEHGALLGVLSERLTKVMDMIDPSSEAALEDAIIELRSVVDRIDGERAR